MVKCCEFISDFTDKFNKGYGIETGSWDVYHGSGEPDESLAEYADQFEIYNDEMITIELDMTQRDNEDGILRYIIHNEVIMDDADILTHDEYTNVAYDDVDIDTKYRLVVAMNPSKSTSKMILTISNRWFR